MKTKLKLITILMLTAALFTACGGSTADAPVTNDPPNDGTPDIVAPAPGNSGIITAGSITANSLVLNWEAATDERTAQLNLVYAVYQSASNNISTVADCQNNGTEIEEFTTGLLNKTVTGLTAGTTYYFNVVVRDSSGNKAVYVTRQQVTTAIVDTTLPVPGGSGTITAGSVTDNSLLIAWDAATDNITVPSDLQYAVYQSTSDNISTISGCENFGTRIQNYTTNITTKNVTGLMPSTPYYFNVIVKDSAGNKNIYNTKSQTTAEGIAPVPGNSGTITVSGVTATSLSLNWTAGTDNVTATANLQYEVYLSTSNNISTVALCESNGTLLQNYTANIVTYNVTGLTLNTIYYFNVIVKDSAGNKAVYTMKQQATTGFTVTYNGNGNTSGNVPTNSTNYSSGATVTVSGNTGNLAGEVITGTIKKAFLGWNTNSLATTAEYIAGDTFTITANITLYAIYTALRVTGPGGGLIFYDAGTVQSWGRYLEAAPSDQSTGAGIRWNNGSSFGTGASATAIGTGLANSNTIQTSQGVVYTSYAAGLARACTVGGFTNWYLPSKDELDAMYDNLKAFDVGGFSDSFYHSSSESGTQNMWDEYFGDGGGNPYNTSTKFTISRVRAIRAF